MTRLLPTRLLSIFLLILSASAARAQATEDQRGLRQEKPIGGITHLNVKSRQMVALNTDCLTNNNFAGSLFYDSRPDNPFVVPKGFSFVITDIGVDPCLIGPNSTDHFLAVLTISGDRIFRMGSTEQSHSIMG